MGRSRTCQICPSYHGFQPVSGTTSRTGKTPMASELMTTAGRVLSSSEPTTGSRLTRQISPRFGSDGVLFVAIVYEFSSLPGLPLFGGLLVVLFHGFGLAGQNLASLLHREVHERPALDERTRRALVVDGFTEKPFGLFLREQLLGVCTQDAAAEPGRALGSQRFGFVFAPAHLADVLEPLRVVVLGDDLQVLHPVEQRLHAHPEVALEQK